METRRLALANAAACAAVLALLGLPEFTTALSPARSAVRVVSIYAPKGTSNSCERVFPLRRVVATPRVLTGAMRALLAGPTKAERSHGYGGWFSTRTAGHLRTITLSGGVARVDFRSFTRDIPNASTSCGSAMLLAQLDRTAKQFPNVEHVVYSFDGSRRAFYEWLQLEPPRLDH
jgi:sporulation and spore germination protein